MGAAGRDFHNFNVCFRDNPAFHVIAFTATQIPYIANRRYPSLLAGRLYPRGIPVYPEAKLEEIVTRHRIDQVVFAYSDISYTELMHKASRVLARGADFRLIGPAATMLKSSRPVISVSAVRTGCGKSEIVRYLCSILVESGIKPVVIRHPMPYGELAGQAVERFENFEDLSLYRCTIEEREEFEPLLQRNAVVYAGVDYERILRMAETEGEVILWDGGNNDFPFICPDLEITIADPLRPGDEVSYFPGEVNVRRAAVIVINKINNASDEQIVQVEHSVAAINPDAALVKVASEISVSDPSSVAGKRVLIIEDGPTITHGNMASGAGLVAANKYGAARIVDPRPYAVGSIAKAFSDYPHIGPVLPALGYRLEQVEELRRTIESAPCDIVLSATPMDLNRLISISRPVVRVYYDISEVAGKPLRDTILRFLANVRNKTS